MSCGAGAREGQGEPWGPARPSAMIRGLERVSEPHSWSEAGLAAGALGLGLPAAVPASETSRGLEQPPASDGFRREAPFSSFKLKDAGGAVGWGVVCASGVHAGEQAPGGKTGGYA